MQKAAELTVSIYTRKRLVRNEEHRDLLVDDAKIRNCQKCIWEANEWKKQASIAQDEWEELKRRVQFLTNLQHFNDLQTYLHSVVAQIFSISAEESSGILNKWHAQGASHGIFPHKSIVQTISTSDHFQLLQFHFQFHLVWLQALSN